MARKAAIFGFLAVQAIALALWLSVILPFASTGKPLTDPAQQIWSGGGYSNLDSSFRSGRDVVLAPRFEPFGLLLTGTILMVLAGVAGMAAIILWRRSKIWLTVGAAVIALLLGAAGNWFLATHWQGDTAFPPGFVNADLLYGISKAFNTQFYIGFALFAVATVLVIAGVATRERALGFQFVAANWVLIALVWLATYVVCFVAPFPFGAD
jgi:hypothetical protein